MEYLVGFVLKLLKIAALAYVYATAVWWLVRLLAARHPSRVWQRLSHNGRQLWQRSFVVAYGALFLFSCTYWGDHGLGSCRLPLGHEEAMEETNTEAYFEASTSFNPSNDGALWVDRFQIADDILCAQANDNFYFTYNLATKENQVFADSLAYNAYAAPRGLPASGEFQTFWQQYSRYWGGWRFWLLV